MKVVCIGSATVDRIVTINSSLRAIAPGDKILASSFFQQSGGGATNVAAGLRRMGIAADIVSKIGRDNDAMFIRKELAQYNIRNECQTSGSLPTSSSVIISSQKDADRIIFVHEGSPLSEKDLPKNLRSAEWVYLGSGSGKTIDTLKTAADISTGRILFNPSLYLAQKGKSVLHPILKKTYILICNREEAQAIVGQKKPVPQLLHLLHRLSPAIVIITSGRDPLYASVFGRRYMLFPQHVRVVDATGAGDAFNSGLLAGIIKKYAFEDCLRLGYANAVSVIQAFGAKTNLLAEKRARATMHKTRVWET